jgi:hypothetical protein
MKLGTWCLRLKSGNHFYFSDEGNYAEAFVKGPNRVLVGGFMCEEASRKVGIFTKHKDVYKFEIPHSLYLKTKESLDVGPFLESLGGVAVNFKKHFFTEVNDYRDNASANACSERSYYYTAVGCDELYNSSKKFTLGLLIANHMSVFSRKSFKETFIRKDTATSDLRVKNPRKASRGRFNSYGIEEFKTPAWYLLNLVGELYAFNTGASVSP